jgi:hypothetical protein
MMTNSSNIPPNTAHKAFGGVRFRRHGPSGLDMPAAASVSVMSKSAAPTSGGGIAFPLVSGTAMNWPHAGQFTPLPPNVSGKEHEFLQWPQTTRIAIPLSRVARSGVVEM